MIRNFFNRTCSQMWSKVFSVNTGEVRKTAATTHQILAMVSLPHHYSCVNSMIHDTQHRHLHSCHTLQCSKKNNSGAISSELCKDLHKDFAVEGDRLKKVEDEREELDGSWHNVDENNRETNSNLKESIKGWLQYVEHKYEKFEPRSSQIIYDYDEEQLRREQGLMELQKHKEKRSIQIPRGEAGVFDIEELVEVLRESNAQEIAVIQVPPEAKYVANMVVVSSQSRRHMASLAEVVRQVYKLKKAAKDRFVQVEGKGSDWMALDLGNIALHIMLPETRELYDIETLWAVGPEFDTKSQFKEESPFDVFRLPATPTIASPENKSTM